MSSPIFASSSRLANIAGGKLSTTDLPLLLSFSRNGKTVIEITKSRDEGHLPGILPGAKMSLRKAKM